MLIENASAQILPSPAKKKKTTKKRKKRRTAGKKKKKNLAYAGRGFLLRKKKVFLSEPRTKETGRRLPQKKLGVGSRRKGGVGGTGPAGKSEASPVKKKSPSVVLGGHFSRNLKPREEK